MTEDLDSNSNLFEHYQFLVDKGQSPLRIDKFLHQRIENSTRNKIQLAAANNYIFVNGKPVKSSYKVQPNDIISVQLPEPVREIEIIPQDIPLDIVFEDESLLVINKEPGMVVHPAYGHYEGTLVNAALGYFQKNHLENAYPHLVHRIDKDTSGLLLLAKNEAAKNVLAEQFFHHTIDRKYMALVWGDVKEDKGSIETYLGRSKNNRKIMTVYHHQDEGKYALTHYKVVERFGYVSLLECKLETGRTHQIRAHMKYLGHPLFNDETYGGNQILRGTTFSKYKQFVGNCFKILPRQGLHAASIGFKHPVSGEDKFFETELPADLKVVIEKWRQYARHSEHYR